MGADAVFVPLKEAARQLGETRERTRQRLIDRQLVGEQRGKKRLWFVDAKSLATVLEALGRVANDDLAALAAEVKRLASEIAALKAAQSPSDQELGRLRGERDRYRAEAATMREAAIHANAAQRAAVESFRRLLDALEEQADAVTELLGPRSPEDLASDSR
jgi:chromosome segregation ATPase